MKTRQLVLDAMLVAMYVLLSLFSIPLGNMKITLEALPVLVGALLFGPIDGLLVGFMGSLLNQMLTYGFTVTTLLWVLPHAASGLAVGLYAKRRGFALDYRRVILITIASALLVTALNTLAMYVDSKIFGYFSVAFVFGALGLRILAGILTAVAFTAILPTLLHAVRRVVLRTAAGQKAA